jgi:hypothetical protein
MTPHGQAIVDLAQPSGMCQSRQSRERIAFSFSSAMDGNLL